MNIGHYGWTDSLSANRLQREKDGMTPLPQPEYGSSGIRSAESKIDLTGMAMELRGRSTFERPVNPRERGRYKIKPEGRSAFKHGKIPAYGARLIRPSQQ